MKQKDPCGPRALHSHSRRHIGGLAPNPSSPLGSAWAQLPTRIWVPAAYLPPEPMNVLELNLRDLLKIEVKIIRISVEVQLAVDVIHVACPISPATV